MSREGESAARSSALSGLMVAEPSDQDVTGNSSSAVDTARACRVFVILYFSGKGENPSSEIFPHILKQIKKLRRIFIIRGECWF